MIWAWKDMLGKKIGPALFRKNESPGALEAGNGAWRQVATKPLEALNARQRAWGARRSLRRG